MNILLLTNGAPNYFNFFNALSQEFMRDGATVAAAVDSHFSRKENRLDDVGFSAIYNFEEFFASHETDHGILERYGRFNLNAALLSDFERAQVYGIWNDEADVAWFDRLKSALLTFYEQIFDSHDIDIVLYENVSNALAHFALFVTKMKGARYCGLGSSRLPNRFTVTADPLDDSETAEQFSKIRTGELQIQPQLREWAKDYIGGIETKVPDYMKLNQLDRINLVRRYASRRRLVKIRSLLGHLLDRRTDAFQIGNPVRTYANLFKRNLMRRLRVGQVKGMYDQVQQNERFLLYPMHFHPESSTSILAGSYLDEYEVIRNIAFNLPEGLRLYVKDHMSAWGFPPLSFYRKLRRLPNVRVLGPNEPTKKLIRDSQAVVTLTSTVGYEALLLKKPVILFGKVFYDFHVGVTKADDPSRLHEVIQKVLSKPVDWDDDYNTDFVSAYHAATLPGTLNLMLDREPAQELAARIYPLLRASRYFQGASD